MNSRKKEFMAENMVLNKYLRYVISYDFLRLIMIIIVLCILILFVRQTKYTIIEEYEINIIVDDIGEGISRESYELSDTFIVSTSKEKYKSNITFVGTGFENGESRQVSLTREVEN